jgi:ELWxxDGT repeat protein
LFFAANDGVTGRELWRSDGSEKGTVLVKDIRVGGSASPDNFTRFNGGLFFTAYDAANGTELWRSDGTEAGTVLVKDIRPGASSSPSQLRKVGGTLYFAAYDDVNGNELWKSDGTEAGTVLVKDIRIGGSANPEYLTDFNGTLFFSADDGVNGVGLWKSDGTELGTVLIRETGADGPASPRHITKVGNVVFFAASDGANGAELWKSDGTLSGTVLVRDINTGTNSSYPDALMDFNGTLFFGADDGESGKELWKSDGTEAGTVLVKDINTAPQAMSRPILLTGIGDTLFFNAADEEHGRELWRSDGSSPGTTLIKDIHPDGSFGPHYLTDMKGTLYFSADDGFLGRELWRASFEYDSCGGDYALVENRSFVNGEVFVCTGNVGVFTRDSVIVRSGADVSFFGPSVVLSAGFSVEASGKFVAGTGAGSVASSSVGRDEAAIWQPSTRETSEAVRLSGSQLPLPLLRRLDETRARVTDLSSDGGWRYIVFATDAALSSRDFNGLADVYLYEIGTGRIRLVSRSLAGYSGFGKSDQPRIDGSGSTVVFVSEADDLIGDDDNGVADIYRYNTRFGGLERVSLEQDGGEAWHPSRNPALDAGGLHIVYDRPDLLGGRDVIGYLETDTVKFSPSCCLNGAQLDNHHPGISSDGRFVVYVETLPDRGAGAGDRCAVIVLDQIVGSVGRARCPQALAQRPYTPYFSSDMTHIEWIETRDPATVEDLWSVPRIVVTENTLARSRR